MPTCIYTKKYFKVSAYSAIGDNMRAMLEELRIRMHMDMTDSVGIPRLDPFTMELLEVDQDMASAMGLEG